MPPVREPVLRSWDAALTGERRVVILDNGYAFEEDKSAVVLVPEGWWSVELLKIGDTVVTAFPEEALCCLDSLRRGERGSSQTVSDVVIA